MSASASDAPAAPAPAKRVLQMEENAVRNVAAFLQRLQSVGGVVAVSEVEVLTEIRKQLEKWLIEDKKQ